MASKKKAGKKPAKYGYTKSGRPKKKPGRKKGSTNKATSSSSGKKKRGRPKGSGAGKIMLEIRCKAA